MTADPKTRSESEAATGTSPPLRVASLCRSGEDDKYVYVEALIEHTGQGNDYAVVK